MEQLTIQKTLQKAEMGTQNQIPAYLVFEEMDGQAIYYKGYKEVLNGSKKVTDIMGCSSLQGMVISLILRFLYKNLPEEQYEIHTNEIGLHISKGNNLSADIAIFEIKDLQAEKINDKYFDIPPKIVIEVDMQAELEIEGEAVNYYHQKAQKLLDFGVEKVIWITTKSQKILIATAHQDWRIMNWNKTIEVVDDYSFSLADLLEKRGLKYQDVSNEL